MWLWLGCRCVDSLDVGDAYCYIEKQQVLIRKRKKKEQGVGRDGLGSIVGGESNVFIIGWFLDMFIQKSDSSREPIPIPPITYRVILSPFMSYASSHSQSPGCLP